MKEIAALVSHLTVTQNNFYMIKEFNEIVKDPKMSVSCFTFQPSPPVVKPMFSCKNVSFVSNFTGKLIATDFDSLNFMLDSHTACEKYLYLWEATAPAKFDKVSSLLKDKRLKIATRSEGHKAILENNYNIKVDAVIDDWNRNQLKKFLGVNNE
jgi:hypothetical protein